MKFDDKSRVVSECLSAAHNEPAWDEFVTHNEVGLHLGYSYTHGYCKLTADGKQLVLETYVTLLASLGVPNTNYGSFEDILDKHLEGRQ